MEHSGATREGGQREVGYLHKQPQHRDPRQPGVLLTLNQNNGELCDMDPTA